MGDEASDEASASGDALSHDEQVARAAAEVAFLEQMAAGLSSGTTHWSQWDESLEGPGQTDAAIRACAARLAEAVDRLRRLARTDPCA